VSGASEWKWEQAERGGNRWNARTNEWNILIEVGAPVALVEWDFPSPLLLAWWVPGRSCDCVFCCFLRIVCKITVVLVNCAFFSARRRRRRLRRPPAPQVRPMCTGARCPFWVVPGWFLGGAEVESAFRGTPGAGDARRGAPAERARPPRWGRRARAPPPPAAPAPRGRPGGAGGRGGRRRRRPSPTRRYPPQP
jgi:hypothetical protein